LDRKKTTLKNIKKTRKNYKNLKLLKLIFCSPAQMNGKVNFDRFYVIDYFTKKGPFTCFVIKWTLQKQRHLAVSFDFLLLLRHELSGPP